MDRSQRLTDGTRWRTFMRLLLWNDLITSYTNARPRAGLLVVDLDFGTVSGLLASQAAEAAGAQGKFWEMHTLLFERQQALRTKDLIRYAEELTLDVEQFRHELKNETHSERVRADFLAGVQNGVYGTPGLFLNGVRYDDAWDQVSFTEPSVERLKGAIAEKPR